MEQFNFWARELKLAELTGEKIRDILRPEIDLQVALWMLVARGEMLAVFGEAEDFSAGVDELYQLGRSEPIRHATDPGRSIQAV